MTIEEYFGDWINVFDKAETMKIMGWLKTVNPNTLCPALPDVFRVFKLCPYRELKVIMIFQDPYPQYKEGKPVATGIAIGNSKDTLEEGLSPSLSVLKESVINFEIPHNFITFDNSLEEWVKQGVLMLNSSLTCEANKIGSHMNIWRPFVSKFIKNLSNKERGNIYVLFGNDAKSLRPYINESFNDIIEVGHPAYYARNKKKLPYELFPTINSILYRRYGETIKWYDELTFNN